MYTVSKAYKNSMKESLRERGYMKVFFGLINQEAEANATVADAAFAYFSNQSVVGATASTKTYATYEQDFTTVDGAMYFLPRDEENGAYYNTGLVSKDFVTEQGYVLHIDLNVIATDIKGITVSFGDAYPVDFDIVTSEGVVKEFRDNDTGDWTTEETFDNTTSLTFIFYKMVNPDTRLRIYSITFGYGLSYSNDDIMDSSLESYISPISSDVSQIDFYVKLQNYDQYFNVDNPKSAINYLETGQEMTIYYGYKLPDSETVEWIKGGTLLCSAWESDDFTATIKCQDMLRTLDEEFYKGLYRADGITLYDLAVDVFADAGVEDYYIDAYLKKIKTKNPLPRVTHREALQIIANAGRCVLSQNRDGIPQIKSSFMPEWTVSCNGEQAYSNVENIKNSGTKEHYAAYAHNYITVDASDRHIGDENAEAEIYTGYISKAQSGEDGTFEENPIIKIVQEAECMYYGAKIVFGDSLPAEFILHLYKNGANVGDITIGESEISKTTVLHNEFPEFDTMEIEFTKTADPYNYIVVDYFSFGDITDFTMERSDMMSSPTAIKQELVKKVDITCYSYNTSSSTEVLISEQLTVTAGEESIFYMGEATYGYIAKFNELTTGVTVIEQGAYYCKVRFSISGTGQFEISGNRYNVVERTATRVLNSRGKTVSWQNPLISDMETAQDLAVWIGDYYDSGIEYEYDTRGNPEIDANDVVYQENAYRDDLKVNIYRHTVNFSQALSGKVVARRYVDTLN